MLFLGGNEHSVKVSSNSERVRAGVPFENFGDYRELILNDWPRKLLLETYDALSNRLWNGGFHLQSDPKYQVH